MPVCSSLSCAATVDDGNPEGTPWIPGTGMMYDNANNECCISTYDKGDRISATLFNGAMTPELGGNVPIFSFGLGGLVLSPSHNALFCSYACALWGVSTSRFHDRRTLGGHVRHTCTSDICARSSFCVVRSLCGPRLCMSTCPCSCVCVAQVRLGEHGSHLPSARGVGELHAWMHTPITPFRRRMVRRPEARSVPVRVAASGCRPNAARARAHPQAWSQARPQGF